MGGRVDTNSAPLIVTRHGHGTPKSVEDSEPSPPSVQSSTGTSGAYHNASLFSPLPSESTTPFWEASRTTQTKVLYFKDGARYDLNNCITGKPAWTCLGTPQDAVLTCAFDGNNHIIDNSSYISIAGIDTSKNQDGSTRLRRSTKGGKYDLTRLRGSTRGGRGSRLTEEGRDDLKSIGNQVRLTRKEEGKEPELAAIFWGGPTFSGAQTVPKTIIAKGAIILEDMHHRMDVEAIGPWGEQVPGGWYGRESLPSEC